MQSEKYTDASMPGYRVLNIPRCYYSRQVDIHDEHDCNNNSRKDNKINPSSPPTPNTVPLLSDAIIYFPSLFLREFVSTIVVLVLNSRLSSDLFIASPIVTLYVNIVFRRPLNNPYVTTLACLSAGDWRKANVVGYPGFNKERTRWWEIGLFWLMMVSAALCGAATAAGIRAYNDRMLGYEFIKGAAWGTGQMYFRANVDTDETCWKREYFGPTAKTVEIPVRLYRNSTASMIRDGNCLANIQWRWWFAEDLGAVLFIIVAYVHIWRWLRWDDMEKSNPNDRDVRYWQKLVTFSAVTASVGLMTTIAFPTANAGMHTSLFLGVYQSLNTDKNVASTSLNEPIIRAFGGSCGCLLAVMYEWLVAWLDTKEKGECPLADAVHKMLYNGGFPEKQAAVVVVPV
jgi:hypothetical protein